MVSERAIRRIVKRAKKYDPDAFSSLYDLYYKKIYRFMFFRVSNSYIAEDLTGDVFYKALNSIDKFNFKGSPFSSWLFTIAHNILKNYYRNESVEKKYILKTDSDLLDTFKNTKPIFKDQLEDQEVISAIDKLNEEQKQVIIYKFISGLNNKEVSRIMKKSVGAVKSLQYRALKNLNSYLSAGAYNELKTYISKDKLENILKIDYSFSFDT